MRCVRGNPAVTAEIRGVHHFRHVAEANDQLTGIAPDEATMGHHGDFFIAFGQVMVQNRLCPPDQLLQGLPPPALTGWAGTVTALEVLMEGDGLGLAAYLEGLVGDQLMEIHLHLDPQTRPSGDDCRRLKGAGVGGGQDELAALQQGILCRRPGLNDAQGRQRRQLPAKADEAPFVRPGFITFPVPDKYDFHGHSSRRIFSCCGTPFPTGEADTGNTRTVCWSWALPYRTGVRFLQ